MTPERLAEIRARVMAYDTINDDGFALLSEIDRLRAVVAPSARRVWALHRLRRRSPRAVARGRRRGGRKSRVRETIRSLSDREERIVGWVVIA